MLFYKAEVSLVNPPEKPEGRERYEVASVFGCKTDVFVQELGEKCHICVSAITYEKGEMMLCIANKTGDIDALIESYLSSLGFIASGIKHREITLESYSSLLKTADRQHYIHDADDVYEALGIFRYNDHMFGHNLHIDEQMLEDSYMKKHVLSKGKRLLCNEEYFLEIDRIYSCKGKQAGHPVQYMLSHDDAGAGKEILRSLLGALYTVERIKSRRYTVIKINERADISLGRLSAIYETCSGGTIVFNIENKSMDDEYSSSTIEEICARIGEIIPRHRNTTLTVFCINRKDESIKNTLVQNLNAVTVVSIEQENAFGQRAKTYLRHLAKKYDIVGNTALYRKIDKDVGYTITELEAIFQEWYDVQLRTKIYPQYSHLATTKKMVADMNPKGCAIEELEKMVGLAEAKSVIHRALDFYKAQKLFADKGFPCERPAMHMVFTGNPGSAKTTVARLFARIMKDNNLLSEGKLYEVGRADLVGKYVGWTAQIVKAKFRAARGSVLFIDEAYSLVDDKGGMFGDEAINTIVQEMENCREDTIVIFAGYPDKMEGFLAQNPGLRSRIAFHVPFADYNADELYEITELMAGKKNITLDGDVKDKLLPIFESEMRSDDFGNGRFARNLFEKAILKQASRLISMDVDRVRKQDVCTLVADDFEVGVRKQKSVSIGFR